MKSLYIKIVIAPTLPLPRQRGRGIPALPDGLKLSPLTLPLSPANGGEGKGEGKDKKGNSYAI